MGVDIYLVGFETEERYVVYYVVEDSETKTTTKPELKYRSISSLNCYGYLLEASKGMEYGSFYITKDRNTLIQYHGTKTHKWYIEEIKKPQ